MKRYYFKGWIDMDDYSKCTSEEEFKADLQSDIIDVLGDIADGKYNVNITKSEEIKEEE